MNNNYNNNGDIMFAMLIAFEKAARNPEEQMRKTNFYNTNTHDRDKLLVRAPLDFNANAAIAHALSF